MQKKKQVSIAAFFSPQAKSSQAAAKKPTIAKDAKQTPSATDAAKDKKTDTDAVTTGAKRPRLTSGNLSKAAASDTEVQHPSPDLRTPSPAPGATIAQTLVIPDSESTSAVESSNEKSSKSEQTTIADLFTTPPPSKRVKPSVISGDSSATAITEPNRQQTEKADTAAPKVTEMIDMDIDDDSDEFLSGDEDMAGGPHAMGPHALPSTAVSKPAAGKSRARKPKASPKAKSPASTTTPANASKSKAGANAKPKAAVSVTTAPTTTTTTPKAREKKQTARAAKENAIPEPAQVEKKEPVVATLDPLVKARVDTYQQKIDELTRQCTHLLQAPLATDGILQEIYGVAIDLALDLDQNQDALNKAIAELFGELSDQHESQNGSDAVTEFSADIKSFIAKSIQGQSASLSSLSHKLLEILEQRSTGDAAKSDAVAVDSKVKDRVLVMLEMEIKMLAQRTNYGVKPLKANLYEDTSADALWIWEIGNLDKYFVEESQKTIKRVRKNRKRLGLQLKTLARVVQLLHQTPVDEVKVSAEEAKVGKFVLAIESETQKAQDRERKELEKVHAAEQKKQQELDKEHAKQEEKRKREEDEEAEKLLANKRKKSLVSYFRSIDKSTTVVGDSAAAPGGVSSSSGTSSSMKTHGHHEQKEDGAYVTGQNEIMARMDAAVGFLVSDGDKPAPSSLLSSGMKSAQEVRAHVLGAGKAKARVTAASGHWSSRRRRDPALGLMKLLQFHENHRPAYYGTFSKKSKVFHGGRRPLAQYTKFDYAVDSEEEWEEEEPGESLSDADSDMDESDDDLDYGDQWLAYEDEVDYIDGAEGDEESKDDGDASRYLSSPERKKKLPAQLEQKKRARVPGRKKAAKPAKLEPKIVGPFLDNDDDSTSAAADNHFKEYTGQLLCQPLFESTLMRKAREYEEEKERQQQQLQLEQQEKLKQLQLQQQQQLAVTEPAAEKPSEDAVVKQKTPLKTPLKTPQKRKMSGENIGLTSPPRPSSGASASASSSTTVTPVKAGITAWLKKPAVVDLSNHESDA